MAASITNPIALSKARLIDLRETVRNGADNLRRQASLRVDITVGTVRDGGLGLAYSTGATALDGAATVGRLIPFAGKLSDHLEKRAGALTDAERDLTKPSVEKYDTLNVKQVAESIEGLGAWELQKIKVYEEAHKNRKTVLAAVKRLLS